jgi:acyl carrier protein
MSETYLLKIQTILADSLGLSADKVLPETTFNDLGMDSLDAMALLNELEIAYDIKIPNDEILKIRSVAHAIRALETYVG